jgi:hypothetical protein
MISFNITSREADCQAKNRLFFATQAEKGRILGFNSGEILLPDLAKNGIRTFFSAIKARQGTIRSFWAKLFVIFNLLWK